MTLTKYCNTSDTTLWLYDRIIWPCHGTMLVKGLVSPLDREKIVTKIRKIVTRRTQHYDCMTESFDQVMVPCWSKARSVRSTANDPYTSFNRQEQHCFSSIISVFYWSRWFVSWSIFSPFRMAEKINLIPLAGIGFRQVIRSIQFTLAFWNFNKRPIYAWWL